jgi:CubicO group peptidase (beta-lactamase class C family)
MLLAFAAASAMSHADGVAQVAAENVGFSSAGLAKIQPWMEERVAAGKVPGMVTMVARHGKVVSFGSAGILDLETGAEVQNDSLFRIYSMTKPVVAVGLMMLYEEDRFELDDPVAKYIPEFADLKVLEGENEVAANRPMTIADLLRHTAGLTYGFFGNTPVDQMYRKANVLSQTDLAAMAAVMKDIPLQFQPGTRWHYSVAVDVTGYLIERISGKTLDVYLDERILQPLGMTDTGFAVPDAQLERFGTNHSYNAADSKFMVIDAPRVTDERPNPGFIGDVTFFSGGGGLVSTAEDYMRFALMLAAGGELNGVRILQEQTLAMMTQDQLPEGIPGVFGGAMRFGYGFAIVGEGAGNPLAIGSPGSYFWLGAAGTRFWVDPVEDLVGIMMIQVNNSREPLANQFAELIYAALQESDR